VYTYSRLERIDEVLGHRLNGSLSLTGLNTSPNASFLYRLHHAAIFAEKTWRWDIA
jgi:hypothetical protein